MISNLILIYYAPLLLSTLRTNMETVNLEYSTKNIPIAQPKEYMKCLLEKTESFLRRVRWKAYHFLNPRTSDAQTEETFGFHTNNSPQPIKELKEFEDRMFTLIQNIDFKHTENDFQNKLSQDSKKIRSDENLLIAADKTTNFYRTTTSAYKDLLDKAITKSYKKAPTNSSSKIISSEKKIAKNLNLDNRIDSLTEKNCFITLKDHKPNFANNPTCRLINPSKSEIGIISKKILQRINAKVVAAAELNQWKNSNAVIDWFKAIPNKPSHSFVTFDVVDFYPSISEELLSKALSFAEQHDQITDDEKHIIFQTKKSLLFNEDTAWCKKDSDTNSLFDVTMGSFDGAETCELVGAYLLSKLTPEYHNNIGLYRDDGLAALNKTPREIENIKKNICQVFKDNNLKITIEANKKSVNFLDLTLDLRTGTYKPFNKPGNIPQYVHRHSNHPPSILKSLPETINKRLSNISSDKQAFDATVKPYQEALKRSGHNYNLHFNPQPPKPKRTRSRNVIWFNPPYSANVATNIGQKFLNIIDQCFPQNNPLRKAFNKNNLKLSYSCMPNMKNLISGHNNQLLNPTTATNNETETDNLCNCRNKELCPLPGKCQTQSIVYQARVIRVDNGKEETYVGLTAGSFKTRFNNHNYSFRNPTHKNSTELSKHIWKLKDANVQHSIKWKIVKKCRAYSSKSKKCNLCLYEKFIIVCHPNLCTLNSRNELISTCRHRRKYLLSHQIM